MILLNLRNNRLWIGVGVERENLSSKWLDATKVVFCAVLAPIAHELDQVWLEYFISHDQLLLRRRLRRFLLVSATRLQAAH